MDILPLIPNFLLPLIILASAIWHLAALIRISKIIHIVSNDKIQLLWKCIALIVSLFFASYLIIAYLIYIEPPILLFVLITVVCVFGAGFVYIISSNSLKVIIKLAYLNRELQNEIKLQEETMIALQDKTKHVAAANVRMTELYLDLEEKKNILEEKEIALNKKNEEVSKINYSLANANSNITNLYVELEEIKNQLMEKKVELIKKNKILSKSNVMMADIFKKFVPEQFLNKIAKEGIQNISCTGYAKRTRLTVAFSDIRSFTNISEEREPGDILTILNKYFSDMAHQIYMNNGFIDKFIGDAIMSLFEVTAKKLVSHASNAINAAIGMQKMLNNTNVEITELLGFPLKMGIGIHTGEVIIGTVGFENRMESTVLGSTVNVASRIETLTKQFGVDILVSQSTLDEVNNLYKYLYRNLGFTKIRGIQNKVHLYEFFDADTEAIKVLKHKTILNFNNAAQFMEQSMWKDAINEYQSALKIFPEDVTAAYLLDLALKNLQGISE